VPAGPRGRPGARDAGGGSGAACYYPAVLGQAIGIAVIVLLSAACFVAGLISATPLLIGAGLLLLALCAIYGAQPGWPPPRRR
jgi:hypothetical protein